MLLKALIATLVVGSSSLALTATADAAPAPVHGVLTEQHVECAPTVPEWTVLSAHDHMVDKTTNIRIGSWNRYSELKLVTNGRNTIDRVRIRFANGSEQYVKLDNTLDRRNPSLTIPLQGGARQIKDVNLALAHGNGGNLSSHGACT